MWVTPYYFCACHILLLLLLRTAHFRLYIAAILDSDPFFQTIVFLKLFCSFYSLNDFPGLILWCLSLLWYRNRCPCSLKKKKGLNYKLYLLEVVLSSEWFGGDGLYAKSYLTLVTPWTAAHQASLSMIFGRQEYWSGSLFPSLGDLDPGIEPVSPALAGRFFMSEPQGKPSVWFSDQWMLDQRLY